MLLAATTAVLLTLGGTSIVTCDATWMDRALLEQTAQAELRELEAMNSTSSVWMMDHCSDESVRIRVFGQSGERERVVPLDNTPPNLKLRTVVLAFGDLAREATAPSEEKAVDEPTDAQPGISDVAAATPCKFESTVNSGDLGVKVVLKKLTVVPKSAPNDTVAPRIDAYFRWFAAAKTYVPEVRIGIDVGKWRFTLGGYGMTWNSPLGRLYLIAFTALIGPNLYHHRGLVEIGIDALMELGAVAIFAVSSSEIDTTAEFNVVAGGHLSFWVDLLPRTTHRLLILAEIGWLRGANAFAGTDYQGGFEGPSFAFGTAFAF